MVISAGVNSYGGGGYIFRLSGFIDRLQEKVNVLKTNNWINNRTRAVLVEFSTYNAQVNMFGVVTCVAEFVGGGVRPWFRVEAIRLFANLDGFGLVTKIAEILFAVTIFYYIVNVVITLKDEGCKSVRKH